MLGAVAAALSIPGSVVAAAGKDAKQGFAIELMRNAFSDYVKRTQSGPDYMLVSPKLYDAFLGELKPTLRYAASHEYVSCDRSLKFKSTTVIKSEKLKGYDIGFVSSFGQPTTS